MKGKYIFDAFEHLDPALIYMAETRVFAKPMWKKVVGPSVAACLILVTGLWTMNYLQNLPSPELETTEQEVQTLPQEEMTDEISDETLLALIRAGETVSEMQSVQHPFIFDSPKELTIQQLYMLFCYWSPSWEEMQPYFNEEDWLFYIPEEFIRSVLDQHLKDYRFSIEELADYDPETDTVRTPTVSGFGDHDGWHLVMQQREQDGDIITCTVEFQYDAYTPKQYQAHRTWKEYRFQVENGTVYFLSARELETPKDWTKAELSINELGQPQIRYAEEEPWVVLGAPIAPPREWSEPASGLPLQEETALVCDYTLSTVMELVSSKDGWLLATKALGVGSRLNYVYRTHDGGRTWEETTQLVDAHWYPTATLFLDNLYAIVGIGVTDEAPVFRTVDGGQTWTKLQLPLNENQTWEAKSITQDAVGIILTMLEKQTGSVCNLISMDLGETWAQMEP